MLEQRMAAYHEAGHAVMAYCCGFNLQLVSLDPDPNDSAVLSYAWYDEPEITPENVDDLVGALAVVHLAGFAAEKIVGGQTVLHAGVHSDIKKVEDLLSMVTGGPGEVQKKLIGSCMQETLRLVEKRRTQILAVAQALLAQRQLSGAEVQRIMAG